jgi:O-antigen/teichoic acid export membrane protein
VALEESERLGYIFDQAFRLVQVAACTLAWAVFAFAPELTLWVGSPLFLPSLGMLQVLALVPLARTSQQPLTMLFQAMRRPGTVLALALIKLGVELGCYFVIVPRMGGLGAAYANLAGAVASYVMALVYAGVLLPEGAGARTAAAVRALLLTLPMLAVSWILSERVHPAIVSFLARAALIVPALVALFALGLITRYDLEKLSALELRAPAVRRLRDLVVGVADRLARVFEPRRTA